MRIVREQQPLLRTRAHKGERLPSQRGRQAPRTRKRHRLAHAAHLTRRGIGGSAGAARGARGAGGGAATAQPVRAVTEGTQVAALTRPAPQQVVPHVEQLRARPR